jgi:hypothetical protein
MAFDRFESVQESILELLQTDPEVQAAVMEEFRQRFPIGAPDHMRDECVCMVQLLVYQRILGEIAS